MIYVQSPLKRDFIRELIDGQTVNDVTFKFEKMDGMKIYFSYEGSEDAEAASKIAKKMVKDSEFGSALYFTVGVEN